MQLASVSVNILLKAKSKVLTTNLLQKEQKQCAKANNQKLILKKHKNLYLETFGFKAQDGIEEVCKVFGAERLIFGSGMPESSGAAAVTMITYANISFEEKQMIASENLEKLLGGVKF